MQGLFSNRKHFVILSAIVFIAISLRIYTFSGFVGLDDAEYARFANQIVNKTFDIKAYSGPPVFPLRIGIIFPASVSFRLFGVSQWSMVLYPLIISIMSIALIYILTTHFFGYHAGLIAAGIWAILPADINYNATKLLPDLPAAFYAALGVASILLLIDSTVHQRWKLFYGGIIGGIAFGLSWLCKESISYLLPFSLALLAITIRKDFRRNITVWAGVATGAFAILSIETIAYYISTGDWLFRFHQIERNYQQLENGFFIEGSKFGWPKGTSYAKALIKRLFISGPDTIFLNIQFLFTPLIGIIATLYARYWNDKAYFIPSLWLITLIFMFNFSSSSTSSYTPLALFERYLYLIYFPAIVLTAGFIDKLLFNRKKEKNEDEIAKERFFWGAIIVLFFLLVAGYQTLSYLRYAKNSHGWADEGKAVSNILKPSDRIYTDVLNIKALEFYWGYPQKMEAVDFEGMDSLEKIAAGSFILIHPTAINWLDVNAGMWLSKGNVYLKPLFYNNIPSSWKVVWQNEIATLYRVE